MTDGKCAACHALLLPFLLHLLVQHAQPSSRQPSHYSSPALYQMIGTGQREEELGVEAVEKAPHPPHQYCSLTWWKLTPANIFHHVIGREAQMPWLDMPTLLPVQTMTQSILHYSCLFYRRWRSLKQLESRGCSRVQLSTSRHVCACLKSRLVSETQTRAPPGAKT